MARKVKSETVLFNISNRVYEESDEFSYKWKVASNITDETQYNGTILMRRKIQNIIGMRVSGVLLFPNQAIYFTQADREKAMLIKEFDQFTFKSDNMMNYHFSFINNYKRTPKGIISMGWKPKNNGFFWFREPIRQMPTSMTLTFANKHSVSMFPGIQLRIASITFGNPTRFNISILVNTGNIADPTIYTINVFGVSTDSDADNSIMDQINRSTPHTISGTDISSGSGTYIEIDVDSSSVVGSYTANTSFIVLNIPQTFQLKFYYYD